MVDWNSRHPDIDTRLQRIAFRIEAQDRRMLRDSVFEQDHINVVMKVLFLLTRWFLPFQFAGNNSADTFEAPASLCKSRITTGTDLDGHLSSIAKTNDSQPDQSLTNHFSSLKATKANGGK
jgi:hypothetical protein